MKNLYEIIESCKKNKQEAQELLYREFSKKMFGICLRYAGNYADAEDYLQDGFILVFNKIRTFKHRGSFEGWLRRIFVNLIFQNLKKKKKIILKEDLASVPYAANELENRIIIPEERLLKFVQELSPRYRMVFNMYVLDNHSHKEIASLMGISVGTSKSNLARARMNLQKKINKHLNGKKLKR